MKTSKRLLSILLMLTMLVSMFTVMASAETVGSCTHEDEVGKTTYTYHEAEEATCTKEGHNEYWLCSKCGAVAIYNASLERYEVQPNGIPKIAIDPTKHQLRQVAAKDATCKEPGNIAYVVCDLCGKMWRDMTLKDQLDVVNTPIDTSKHKLDKVDAKDPTCTEDGNVAYSQCSVCGKVIDAEGEGNEPDGCYFSPSWVINPYEVIAKAATCTENGIKKHYKCARTGCGALFEDEAGTKPLTDKDVVIPATGHDLEHVAAKEPTKTATGNIEYWHCKRCDKYFSDKDATAEIRKEDTVIPQLKEEKHTLTIVVSKVDGVVPGEVQYAGKPYEMLEGLQKGETKELTAVAKSGYQFKEWKINGDGASVSDLKKATTTVTMGDTNATITAALEDNHSRSV